MAGVALAGKGVVLRDREGLTRRGGEEGGVTRRKEVCLRSVLGPESTSRAEHSLLGGERENATNAIFGRSVKLCYTWCNVC